MLLTTGGPPPPSPPSRTASLGPDASDTNELTRTELSEAPESAAADRSADGSAWSPVFAPPQPAAAKAEPQHSKARWIFNRFIATHPRAPRRRIIKGPQHRRRARS